MRRRKRKPRCNGADRARREGIPSPKGRRLPPWSQRTRDLDAWNRRRCWMVQSRTDRWTRQTATWSEIDWTAAEAVVKRLQGRIYRAAAAGNGRQVKNLQKLLVRSTSAKRLAVRRVAQQNAGRNTPGIDGVVCGTPESRMRLATDLSLKDYHPQPVRRVYIPKTDGRRRPLGIPTIRDRALQMLVKMALEPEWETRFEANSYGFRPGRCTMDAIVALHALLAPRVRVNGCSMRTSPAASTTSGMARCLPNCRRSPPHPSLAQGRIGGTGHMVTNNGRHAARRNLSPVLANVALDGMERLFGAEDRRQSRQACADGQARRPGPVCRRSGGDGTAGSPGKVCDSQHEAFLEERGLKLNGRRPASSRSTTASTSSASRPGSSATGNC